MFERFTDRARRVVVLAQEETRLLCYSYIGTEHLLLGMIHEDEGVASKVLDAVGITLETTREQVIARKPPDGAPLSSIPFTPDAKRVIEHSLRVALDIGHSYIGTEHLLLALLRVDCTGGHILLGLGADFAEIERLVKEQIGPLSPVPDPTIAAAVGIRHDMWRAVIDAHVADQVDVATVAAIINVCADIAYGTET